MCYDLAFDSSIESILDYFPNLDFSGQQDIKFTFNAHYMGGGFPKYPVIINEQGKPTLSLFEWGVIPPFWKTPEEIKKKRTITWCNAQSERVLDDKKSFWYRIRKNRCLIPSTGIYEHRRVNIRGLELSIPYHVKVANRKVFFLPGLYSYSPLPDPETGEVKGTFTLITRPANELMKKIHNSGENKWRMPLFLQTEQAMDWIRNDLTEDEMRSILNFEIPSEELEHHTVFSLRGKKAMNYEKPKNLLYEWEGVPELGIDEVAENTLF